MHQTIQLAFCIYDLLRAVECAITVSCSLIDQITLLRYETPN